MEWEKRIKDLFKNLDNLIPFLVFAVMILGPIIKAVLQKKKEEKSGGAPRPERQQEEAPSWWEEQPEAQTEEPPAPIPRPSPEPIYVPKPEPVERPQPAPVAAMQEAEIPIERASEDVVEEAARVAYEADSVSAFSREEKFTPATASAFGSAVSKESVAVSSGSAFDRLSPLEAAIVLGAALDRPVAFSEPTWGRF